MEVLRKRKILADLVLKVWNVRAATIPAYFLRFWFLLRVASDLHSVVKHRVCFVIIQDVELHRQARPCVLHPKIEPLRMPMCINVVLHQAVVFLVTHLSCKEQVPTLESAFKYERPIFLIWKSVTGAAIPTILNKAAVAKFIKGLWFAWVNVSLQCALSSYDRLWKIIGHFFGRFSISDQLFDI